MRLRPASSAASRKLVKLRVTPGKVELAIVAAGARTDLGQPDAAVAELEFELAYQRNVPDL